MTKFEITADAGEVMERIIDPLTSVQQSVLVHALEQSKRRDVVPVSSANERTVVSLMRGVSPLIRENRVRRRVLTPLGMDVAKYLIATRDFPTMDLDSIIPDLTQDSTTEEGEE